MTALGVGGAWWKFLSPTCPAGFVDSLSVDDLDDSFSLLATEFTIEVFDENGEEFNAIERL